MRGINRRKLLAGLAGLPLAGMAAAPRGAVRALRWSGTAEASVGGRALSLIVETQIELPILRVRSVSRIATEPAERARTMILAPDDAWVEAGGQRRALPSAIATHERQQYAIYALLLDAQSRPRVRSGTLALDRPPYPPIRFTTGADGYPTTAELIVSAPEAGKPPIAERIAFAGRMDSNGVRWPGRFAITQNGEPYFTLTLSRFEAIRA